MTHSLPCIYVPAGRGLLFACTAGPANSPHIDHLFANKGRFASIWQDGIPIQAADRYMQVCI